MRTLQYIKIKHQPREEISVKRKNLKGEGTGKKNN